MKPTRTLILAAIALMVSLSLAAQVKPKVYILATGGTIAGTGASQTASAYTAGTVTVDKLLAAVPELLDLAEVKGEQIVNIASQDMTDAIWLTLAKRVNQLLAQQDVTGVVITHGTDTQEETAYFLNLVVRSGKPVVLVGSMRPSTAMSADGPRNLYNAVAYAVSPLSFGRGVVVVMDDRIVSADDVSKTNTIGASTFRNPNFGDMGVMYDSKPIFNRESARRHTVNSEFDVSGLDKLPRVEIITSYANATSLFADAAVNAGAKGIVVAGVGNGNMSAPILSALEAAHRDKGVAVVRSSRIPTGPTTQWDELDDDKLGFATSWYLSPQRARVLLMLALTKTTDYKEIQRMFVEY